MRLLDDGTEKDKRGLVAELKETIERWPGLRPLMSQGEREVRVVIDLLWRRRLARAEEHWLGLCEIWLAEARRHPEPWLKAFWLQTVSQWDGYLEQVEPPRADVLAPSGRPDRYS